MHTLTRIVILGLVGCLPNPCYAADKVITACQLVEEMELLDGRVVSVRGVLRGYGPNHEALDFDVMVAENCPGHKQSPVEIRLVSPDAHFLKSPPAGFEPDMVSYKKLEEFLSRLFGEGRRPKQLTITVKGAVLVPKTNTDEVRARRTYHKQYRVYVVVAAYLDFVVKD